MVSSEILNKTAPQGCGIVYGYFYKNILVYIGSTKYTIGKRAGINGKKYVYFKSSAEFGEFILLHGWENFEVKVLATPKLAELTKVENELIDQYDLINNGCNTYHACADEEDENEFTTTIDGYKANVKHEDKLRGDVRIGTIHDRTLKLNLVDQDIFNAFYIAPSHGNKEKNNPLTFFDLDNSHTTVKKYLRKSWLKELAEDYNISIDLSKAEDYDDYRREVIVVNKVGRSYKKEPLIKFMREHNL